MSEFEKPCRLVVSNEYCTLHFQRHIKAEIEIGLSNFLVGLRFVAVGLSLHLIAT
jgi:hypothetical protein